MVIERDFIKVAAYSASLVLCVHNYVYKFGRKITIILFTQSTVICSLASTL